MEVITFSEFLDWVEFLGVQERRMDKIDFYLAQIAAEVRRGVVKNPKTVNVKDFYVNYTNPVEAANRTKKSKAAWGAVFKMDLN